MLDLAIQRSSRLTHFERTLCLIFCIFFALTCAAEDVQQPIADVYHSSWTTKDGAPRGITSFAQTRDGYLWIGTILGLYRFDGSRFSEYPPDDSTQPFRSTDIRSLALDEDGRGVWVGYRHGISHVVRGHLVNLTLPSLFTDDSINSIECCAQHSLWVRTRRTILRWKDGTWEDFASLHGLPHGLYFALYFDRDGNIWASLDEGVYMLRPGESSFSRIPMSLRTTVMQFAQANDGSMWIADANGHTHPLKSSCQQPALTKPVGLKILFDNKGKLWTASTEHGISRLELTSDPCHDIRTPEFFTSANGLTSNSTHALLQDHFGDLWVGTSMGIDRFRRRYFTSFGDQDFERFPSLAAAPDGSVWIQETNHRLVHVSSRGTEETGPPRDRSPLTSDATSGVWLFDQHAKHFLHYNSFEQLDQTVSPPGQLGLSTVTNIVSKPDGSVLVAFAGVGGTGLWSYSKTWRAEGDLPAEAPSTLVQDGDTTWIGYFNNRLESSKGNRSIKYGASDGLNVDVPLVITRHHSVLWVGGSEGVNYMSAGRFHTLLVRAPEKLRGVSGLLFDNNDDLWLNTGFGAMQIKSKEVEKALQNPEYAVITEVYGSADGVVGIPAQSSPTPSLVQDGTGRLWFGTEGHLVNLKPGVLTAPQSQPFVDLLTVRINGKRIAASDFDNPVRLDGGRMNKLEFQYTAVDLDHPHHIVFRYRLEGEEKVWQAAGSSHMAMYSRLRPGHYAFRVAARKGDAPWVELSTPFQFDITPAFYQTTWFLAVCWVSGFLCLWFLVQLRVRFISARLRNRLEERSDERMRIARDLHDTLLQSIHGLMLRFHYAAESLEPEAPARPALEIALKRADALILEARNSLQQLRGEADKARSLSELLAEAVRDMANSAESSIQIMEGGIPRPLCPLIQEEFCRIGSEAIFNALRHAKANRIQVEVDYGRRFFRLICRDDGIGIPDEVVQASGKNGHWGLKGMQERAQSIGAKFLLWTGAGQGTEIDVRLRSRLAYDHTSYLDRISSLFRRSASERPPRS